MPPNLSMLFPTTLRADHRNTPIANMSLGIASRSTNQVEPPSIPRTPPVKDVARKVTGSPIVTAPRRLLAPQTRRTSTNATVVKMARTWLILLNVGNDGDPHYDEVNVTEWLSSNITASHPHTASTPKLSVALNAHSAVVPPASPVAPQDHKSIYHADISIDVMTKAFATMQTPAQIGPKQWASLQCNIDIGNGGNVMPLCAFTKLPKKSQPLASTLVRITLQPAMILISLNMVPSTLPSCGRLLSHPRCKAWKPPGMLLTHLDLPSMDYPPVHRWGLFTSTALMNSANVVLPHQSLLLRGGKCSVTWLACPPWFCQGQNCEGDACSTITHRIPKLSRNGNLPSTLHTLTLHTHNTTMGTTHKRCGIHLECNLPKNFYKLKSLVCTNITL